MSRLVRGHHVAKLRPSLDAAVLGASLGRVVSPVSSRDPRRGENRVVLEIALRVVQDPLIDNEAKWCSLWVGAWMLRVSYAVTK